MADLELALTESVARVCGIDATQVSPSSTLDELGIDSLEAAELVTDLEIRMGVELPVDVLRRLAQAHTVADVAAQLRLALSDAGPGP